MLYVSNAFSLGQLPHIDAQVFQLPVELPGAMRLLKANNYTSIVGHEDISKIFSQQLNVPVSFNRASVQLKDGDQILVGQYIGPRLPEGATQLPGDAKIQWRLIKIYYPLALID